MRKPYVSELVRANFQFRNAQTGAGLTGIGGVEFHYTPPGATVPVAAVPSASLVNPVTGLTEAGWFFVDIPTTVAGTYRCIGTCETPSRAVAVGSFSVAPLPFAVP